MKKRKKDKIKKTVLFIVLEIFIIGIIIFFLDIAEEEDKLFAAQRQLGALHKFL